MKAAATLCAVPLLCACSRAPSRATDADESARKQDTSREQCYQPLSAYCQATKCPDYARSLAAVRRAGASGRCWFASAGKCGALRFTSTGGGYGSNTEYFDASGKLVAAHGTTDAYSPNPTCPNWKTFGQPIDCTFAEEIEYCGQGVKPQRPVRLR